MPYWIVSLSLKHPTLVTGPGRYVTHGGEVVTIDRVDSHRAFGQYGDRTPEMWTRVGRVLPHYLSQNDIVGIAS